MLGPRSNVVKHDQHVYTGLHQIQPAVVLLLSLAKASMEVPMALSPSSTVPSPWRFDEGTSLAGPGDTEFSHGD